MFGSSVSGFGLKSSDVNLGLNFGDPTSGNTKLTDMMPHEALDMAFQILKEDKEFRFEFKVLEYLKLSLFLLQKRKTSNSFFLDS